MLTKEEHSRYNRHIILPEVGVPGQEKLKAAKVLVIGAGGLGCPVLQYLAAAGVGTIGIADDDVISESNLQRQVLYASADIGKPKVIVATEKLRLLNPFIVIKSYNLRINAANAAEIVSGFDVVVDGSDNFSTRYIINDVCVKANKPLVFGAVHKFEGQVSVFNYRGGPTYRCLFPEAGDTPSCAEAGVLGVLPGITGCIQANETIKIITGIGKVLSGRLLTVNALTLNIEIFSFRRSSTLNPIEITGSDKEMRECASQITSAELKELLTDTKNTRLVDVREKHEHEEFNIGGENIPLHELEHNLHKISDKKQIILYCRSGARSRIALQLLRKLGLTNVYTLNGGIDSFKSSSTVDIIG